MLKNNFLFLLVLSIISVPYSLKANTGIVNLLEAPCFIGESSGGVFIAKNANIDRQCNIKIMVSKSM